MCTSLVKGGVLSLSELQKILELCKILKIKYLQFGSRQDILLPIDEITKKLQQESSLEITNRTYKTSFLLMLRAIFLNTQIGSIALNTSMP